MLSITNVCVKTNSAGGGVSIIEFKIVDAGNTANVLGTYQCEDGMTWQEFVDSKYNTDNNFYIENTYNYVHSQKTGTTKVPINYYVSSNDVIKNQTYLVVRSGIVIIG